LVHQLTLARKGFDPKMHGGIGTGIVGAAVLTESCSDAVSACIERGYDVNFAGSPECCTEVGKGLLAAMKAAADATEEPTQMQELFALFDGATALIVAAYLGKCGHVQLLIAAGAQLEAVNSYHRTALHYASMAGHVEIVKTLLAAGCRTDVIDKHRRSAAGWAVERRHWRVAELLAQTKALAEGAASEPQQIV